MSGSGEDERLLPYLRRATIELKEARQRLGELEGQATEPIAIVGIGCRFPGEVGSAEALWRLVDEGRDAIGLFPDDRGWELEALYDPDPDRPGTSYAREGGFLAGAAGFDAEFFDISPREALGMDPQQRLLLEVAWEALEQAGIDPEELRGSEAGVFAGATAPDYSPVQGAGPAEIEGLRLTGNVPSVISGRVSYALGLEGPAVTVDTACSSSLVAMHQACQALRAGECDVALAGGVTVLSTPALFIEFSRQRGLAPDGRCKSFAAAADGTGFSDGVGVLVLEPLSEAQRKGHRVLAVIRGSAVNQDGASNGLTAPNGPSQERVIRRALASAGLTTADIDAVEAHGTGTTLGDPIEAGALLATYGQDREESEPLYLGSVKSNIGHANAAAGVAGVIKMVMALNHQRLPATLHLDEPSPHVDWDSGAVELLREAREWPAQEGRARRAGVSSFGVSGTNAHVIVEEAPALEAAETESEGENGGEGESRSPLIPWILSARSPEALQESAAQLASFLAEEETDPLAVAAELIAGRARLEHRAVLLGADTPELLAGLGALASGERPPTKVNPGRTAFLFSGQGAQRPGMGRQLYESFPAYRGAFDRACAALDPHLEAPLAKTVFEADAETLARTELTQPALFALQVALGELLDSLGVRPEALAGHSVGEIAAAHLAGVLSLEDAAKLVAARGRLMGALPQGGAMGAIRAKEQEVAESLASYPQLAIAAINGPESLVVSGDRKELEEWAKERKVRWLEVSHAFHSPLMDPILEEFRAVLSTLEFKEPQIPFAAEGDLTDPERWVAHLREPVRFADAVTQLSELGASRFLELGPDAALSPLIAECLPEAEPLVAALLRRDRGEVETLLGALGAAHEHGAEVEWGTLIGPAKGTSLPTYPFQRRRYWLEAGAGNGDLAAGMEAVEHPILNGVLRSANGSGLVLTGRLSLQAQPWLADHAVLGTTIVPGTAIVELALRAGEEAGREVVEELTLEAPLVLREGEVRDLQVLVETGDEATVTVSSAATGEGDWTCHASGRLSIGDPRSTPSPHPQPWPPEGARQVPIGDVHDRLAAAGFEYGAAFQGLRDAWQMGDEVICEAELDPDLAAGARGFGLHPALLDAVLQTGVLVDEPDDPGAGLYLFAWSGVRLHRTAATGLRARLRAAPDGGIGVEAWDESGAPVLEVRQLLARGGDFANVTAAAVPQLAWTPVAADVDASPPLPEDVTVLSVATPGAGEDVLSNVRRALASTLSELQDWLAAAADDDTEARLAVVTRNAVATAEDEAPDLALAACWGLLRSAQSEHPDRIVLVDLDEEAEEAWLATCLASGEPQLAVRSGRLLAPRLGQPRSSQPASAPDFSEGTVVISGATGGLGALVARHLARDHGARRMLLLSRSGPEAQGAQGLVVELEAEGCEATLLACDVGDREALAAALAEVDDVVAVVHAAGVLDDGLIERLDAARLDAVLGPKADGAWHLHELLPEAELVLFSSAAGLLGAPGQGSYAAANAFLDALAEQRRSRGQPAKSLAWGPWELEAGMAASLGEAERARMRRAGVRPLSAEHGLELFDRALGEEGALTMALSLDRAALRGAQAAEVPMLLRGLLPARSRRAGGSLASRLANVPEAERETFVLEEVRGHVAAVLGHADGSAIDPQRAFKELGFDSLAAVELRNRLAQASGLRLAPTLVFDHPSSAAVAAALVARLAGTTAPSAETIVPRLDPAEPIAIVGIGCRYPGEVGSAEALWQLVDEGRDAIGPFPDDRGWDLDGLYDPDPDRVGKVYAKGGGFLADAAGFDAEFFAISPREALAMDPQQRLLLEVAWEALEQAGIDPGELKGSETGVFAGATAPDYSPVQGTSSAELEGLRLTGNVPSVISGRVSYALGLEGPAVTVDTACSSSLVAMHQACSALRAGECSMALAGGVTVLSTPGLLVEFARQRGLAPDGRCKSFAAAADGTGFAEGAGLLVLEPLSQAQRKGRRVLAVVKGSAVNQDGASNGLTAPNGPSQERVIRRALQSAGLTTTDIDAVEAHGTGTTLGDPIEAGALLATYGQDREGDSPLYLGSVKSNIGHANAAAGVAGVIKMVMALNHQRLPATLHLDEPSPHVDWDSGAVELLREAREWPAQEGKTRRAGVSSFGVSGTNAHVIVEEAPELVPVQETEQEIPPPPLIPWILSARSPTALQESAEQLSAFLAEHDPDPLAVAAELIAGRARLEHRAVLLGADTPELLAGLGALASGERPATKVNPGRTAFLFSGQGAQRPAMGRELYEAFPIYRESFDRACAALDPHLEAPLAETVFEADAETLARTELTQPALFALQVALAALLDSLGARPEALAGHSVGEIAAAHLAGVLSLEDAAKLVAARGRLMGALPEGGAMAAIRASEPEIAESLASHPQLAIAAVNGPESLVVSGDRKELQEWAKERKVRWLEVSHAFHSPLMDPILEEFRSVLSTLEFSEPQIPFAASGDLTDPERWVAHLREPVRFADAVTQLHELGAARFLELGPDAALSPLLAECLPEAEPLVAPLLRRDRGEVETLLGALGAAHEHGAEVEWGTLIGPAKGTALPTYPFQRRRYWLSPSAGGGDLAAGMEAVEHPILNGVLRSAAGEALTMTGHLSLRTHPWLLDHEVLGAKIVPGTALVELALRAAAEAGCAGLEELTLEAPLVMPEQGGVRLQVEVTDPGDGSGPALAIAADAGGGWARHASGVLARSPAGDPVPTELAAWPPPGAEPLDAANAYAELADAGFAYGPSFRRMRAAWRSGDELLCEVVLDDAGEAGFGIHPALLDAALHPMLLNDNGQVEPRIPFSWTGVELRRPGARALRVRLVRSGEEAVAVSACDDSGQPVIAVASLVARPVDRRQLAAPGDGLLALRWVEVPGAAAASTAEAESPLRLTLSDDAAAALEATLADRSEPPALVVLEVTPPSDGDVAIAARRLLGQALGFLRHWLADERLIESRLLVLTRGAVAARPGAEPELLGASLWGMLRSAQAENPDRIVLVDGDGGEDLAAAMPALDAGEPQLAVREGVLLAPRLAKLAAGEEGDEAPFEGTVLITGGTGGLGALVARHLAGEHDVRRLVLIGRRGPDAEGAGELVEELTARGCEVEVLAADVADRGQLAAALEAAGPVDTAIHAAGVLDDAVVTALDEAKLDQVLRPKLDGAIHLQELLPDAELIFFSSAAGVVGSPGQAGYAAANAFLDALAERRHAGGLRGRAVAWGLWDVADGMGGGLAEADRVRLARTGLKPLTPEVGLPFLGRARGLDDVAVAVALPLEMPVLRGQARDGVLPAVLSRLVPVAAQAAAVPGGTLPQRLATVAVEDRPGIVLEEIRSHVAAVLGYADSRAVDPERSFQEFGLDSLGAVELRNRLARVTGLRLSPALIFDHPTVAALAEHLSDRIGVRDPGEDDLDRLEALLVALSADEEARERLVPRLQVLESRLQAVLAGPDGESDDADLEAASDEEIFELIDKEFGAA